MQEIQDYFSQLLVDYLAAHAHYQEKFTSFVQNSLIFYARDAKYPYVALSYRSSHKEQMPEELDDLMLLSYFVETQTRLIVEQITHSQVSLRKTLNDDYCLCLNQFLTQQITSLVTKINRGHVTALVQQFFELAPQAQFELSRFKQQKPFCYQTVHEFYKQAQFQFHVALGNGDLCQLKKISGLKAELKLLKMNEIIEVLEFVRRVNKEAYQEVLIAKYDPKVLEQLFVKYGIQQKIDQEIEDTEKELKDAILGVDCEWEWILSE